MLNLLLAAAVGVALVGFAVGTKPMPQPDIEPAAPSSRADAGDALEGQSYPELRTRRQGPQSRVTSPLDSLRRGLPKAADGGELSEAQALRRAFEGAPPVVPHPIDQQGTHSCLSCHEHSMKVGDRVAPVTSHPLLANCTQCHVSAEGGGLSSVIDDLEQPNEEREQR